MKIIALMWVLVSAIAFESAGAQTVTLQTDKLVYEFGEPVQIMMTNGLNTQIAFPCDPSWEIRTVPADSLVSPCGCFTWITFLGPGESVTHVAEQWDCSGSGAPHWPGGPYEVTLHYFVLGARGFETVSTSFCVGPDCVGTSVEDTEHPTSWGRLKGEFR